MNYGALIFGVVAAAVVNMVSSYEITDWQWWIAIVLLNAGAAICYE